VFYAVLIFFVLVFFAMISSFRHSAKHPGSTEPPPWVSKLPLLPFLLLALMGLVLSIVVHGLSVFGVRMPGGRIVWWLHLGIFFIWLPAVFLSQKRRAKDAVDRTPAWMKRVLGVLFAYAIGNFIYFVATAPKKGSPEARQQQQGPPPAQVVRGFSGHWMIFYGAGFAMLWSAWMERRAATSRRCSNGHPVPPLVTQCPTCGAVVPDKPLRIDPKNFA
jgi:hypothetical protein